MNLFDFKSWLMVFFVLMFLLMSKTIAFAQEQKYDLIVKNDGTKIEAVVQYVELDVVKYKNFNNPEGPLYSISKNDIATILYANGTVDVFQKDIRQFVQEQNSSHNNIKSCEELQNDLLKACKLSDAGTGLYATGLVCFFAGNILFWIGAAERVTEMIITGAVLIIPVSFPLIISGAIIAGIGNGRMRRISGDMNEICSLPLNKGAKYPVNLSFTINGLALRF